MRSDFSLNEVENQNQASQTNKELIIANLACSFPSVTYIQQGVTSFLQQVAI